MSMPKAVRRRSITDSPGVRTSWYPHARCGGADHETQIETAVDGGLDRHGHDHGPEPGRWATRRGDDRPTGSDRRGDRRRESGPIRGQVETIQGRAEKEVGRIHR